MPTLIKKKSLFLAPACLPFRNDEIFESINLVVDTGAGLTIVDTSIIDYLGYSARDAFDTPTLDGAGGISNGYVIKLRRFRCLGFELDDFTVACHDMNTRLGVTGLLGMNFLRHFRMDVDYNSGRIYKIEKSDRF